LCKYAHNIDGFIAHDYLSSGPLQFIEPHPTMLEPSIPGFITEKAQAAKSGVSLATLRRWRKRGYGPRAVRYGRRFLYREDADVEFLARVAEAEAQQQPRRRGRPALVAQ